MTKIYEANNHILIRTGYADPVEHCHMAAHIIISMEEEIRIVSEDTEYLCHGIMIPSGIAHMVDTNENDVLVFVYDCTTSVAKQIHKIEMISKEVCNHIVQCYNIFEQSCNSDAYSKFEKKLLKQLNIVNFISRVEDERILCAMEYIRSSFHTKISCKEVAKVVNLSQGRFSHLFKEKVGMTFAAYLIYQRIMHVYYEIFHGKSITEAALESGFSSSAHFADVNRRVFGISASNIIHNAVYIKV